MIVTQGTQVKLGLITCCLTGLMIGHALAAELPKESVLPLALATKAAHATVDKCLADGYRVSVTVVDQGGNIRAVLRQDGDGPHTIDSSRKKAYTSASMKQPTAKLAELVAKMPAVQGLQHMNDHMLLLGGGLPITLPEVARVLELHALGEVAIVLKEAPADEHFAGLVEAGDDTALGVAMMTADVIHTAGKSLGRVQAV